MEASSTTFVIGALQGVTLLGSLWDAPIKMGCIIIFGELHNM